MSQKKYWGVLILAVFSFSCSSRESGKPLSGVDELKLDTTAYVPKSNPSRTLNKIAFGSCSHQDKPQPILRRVISSNPDLFVYLGDNLYGDTGDMGVLRQKYQKLGNKEEFKALQKATDVVATWDDHDYGENDAGRYYPYKKESKNIFLNFWGEPSDSRRRTEPGIYTSYRFGSGEKVVQVILLDCRTFRDNLLKVYKGDLTPLKSGYRPNQNPAVTLLGKAQWAWLEERLEQPATIRIIASSIQLGHQYDGGESWTNLPHERQKMVNLIKHTGAEGVFFISGDAHWGELNKLETEGLYPLYDVTASGLTESANKPKPSKNRIGEPVMENHFGMVEIDWAQEVLFFKLIDISGRLRVKHQVAFSDLKRAGPQQ